MKKRGVKVNVKKAAGNPSLMITGDSLRQDIDIEDLSTILSTKVFWQPPHTPGDPQDVTLVSLSSLQCKNYKEESQRIRIRKQPWHYLYSMMTGLLLSVLRSMENVSSSKEFNLIRFVCQAL